MHEPTELRPPNSAFCPSTRPPPGLAGSPRPRRTCRAGPQRGFKGRELLRMSWKSRQTVGESTPGSQSGGGLVLPKPRAGPSVETPHRTERGRRVPWLFSSAAQTPAGARPWSHLTGSLLAGSLGDWTWGGRGGRQGWPRGPAA